MTTIDFENDTSDDEEIIEITEDNARDIVLDFSLNTTTRVDAFKIILQTDGGAAPFHGFELFKRICSMYQMSGTYTLQCFLSELCKDKQIPSLIKLESSKTLIEYRELLTDDVSENVNIRKRNIKKEIIASESLNIACSIIINDNHLATPLKIESIFLLMKYEKYRLECEQYFNTIINNKNIDVDFRYKTILSIENENKKYFRDVILDEFDNTKLVEYVYNAKSKLLKIEFPKYKPDVKNYIFFNLVVNRMSQNELKDVITYFSLIRESETRYMYFMHKAFISFLFTKYNRTMYKILAAQYLLQFIDISNDERENIQECLMSFCNDKELWYNLRADAADVLLRVGNDKYKNEGRQIIKELGGSSNTIFENSQNVHTEKIDESVNEILEFFSDMPLMKVNDIPITFDYVKKELYDILKAKKVKKYKINMVPSLNENCKFCDNIIAFGVADEENNTFCSDDCIQQSKTEEKIKLSLNRISMDRALYSRYNNNLRNIILKIWTYINNHKHREELIKRLLEELEEMSGTCSSGFASRLINTISGFGDFSIRISWLDQIVSNLAGRLNHKCRMVTKDSSLFKKQPYLNDIIGLWINNNIDIKNELLKKIELGNKSNVRRDALKDRNMENIIKEFLKQNEDIDYILHDFADNILSEMTNNRVENKRYFNLFFKTYLPFIREEMYSEFKDYLDDTTFDLFMRKAISFYDGGSY